MYVDDALFGADNKEDAVFLAKDFTNLLMAGGFPLHEWVFNELSLLSHLPLDWLKPAEDSQKLCDQHKFLGLV